MRGLEHLCWILAVSVLVVVYAGSAAAFAAAPAESGALTWGGSLDDAAGNVVVDAVGNVYVAGGFGDTVDFDPDPASADPHASNGGQDVFLVKLDANGVFQWARTWGGSGREAASGLAVDTTGCVYVSGAYQYTVDFDPDLVGTEYHTSNAGAQNNIYLSKFQPDGSFEWVRTWGGVTGGESYSIAVDSSNHVYVVGDFSNPAGVAVDFNPWTGPDEHYCAGFFDAYLSKFSSDGTLEWAKTWGGEGYDDGPGVAVDGSGNVYVAGMYASLAIDFDPAGGGAIFPAHDSGIVVDVFLSKFDADGVFQWVRTWGAQGTDDIGVAAAADAAGNVYVAGRYASTGCDFDPWGTPDIHSTNGSHDAFVSKFDSSGTFLWSRSWGGADWDAAGRLVVDRSGNVQVSGGYRREVDFDPGDGVDLHMSSGQSDAFFTSFAPDGSFRWALTWGGTGDDFSLGLALSGAGDTYAVGGFEGTVAFDPVGGGDPHTSNGLSDVFVSRFLATDAIFADGFESGTTAAWSATRP